MSAITAGDISLIASQVMDDVEEGGGAPTAHVIQDGVSNSIFPDISEVDRAGGRARYRKVFVRVANSGQNQYLGANVIVSEIPADPRVSVLLFSASGFFDRRSDARDRVEAYLNRGSMWPGFLLENHIAGQRSIQICQRENIDPPTIGKTLFLVKNEGSSSEVGQYVRITRVSAEVRTFTILVNGTYVDFSGLVCTCDISDALRYDFVGSAPNRLFSSESNKTLIRDTLVADAASYFSAAQLAAPAALGDVKVRVGSIFTSLVPNSQTETALTNQRAVPEFMSTIATQPRNVTVAGAPFSQRIKVRQETRAFNYVTILKPLPAPGAVRITYRAQGRTYTLTDDGAGNLVGTGGGSGRIEYLTGSVRITLGSLPDEGSAIVFYWGQNVSYTNRSADIRFRLPEVVLKTANRNLVPGSLAISWLSGGVLKTATDNSQGELAGHGLGRINYATGDIFLRPSAMIDAGGQYGITYDWAEVTEEVKTGITVDATGSTTFSFEQDPVPGSISVEWLTTRQSSATRGSSLSSGSTNKSEAAGMNKVAISSFGLLNSYLGAS